MPISQTVLSKLKDPSLVTDRAFIAGEWIAKSDSGQTFDVTNPSNGEVIATLPDMNRAEAARAIDVAYEAPQCRRCWPRFGAPNRTDQIGGTILRLLNPQCVAYTSWDSM